MFYYELWGTESVNVTITKKGAGRLKKRRLTSSWRVPLCLFEGRSSVWARRKCQRWNLMVQSHHSVEDKQARRLIMRAINLQIIVPHMTTSDHYSELSSDLSTGKAKILQSLKDPLLCLSWCKCSSNAIKREREKGWVRQTGAKWDGIMVDHTVYPINVLLPSHRNLPIHIGQEAHSHPTMREKERKGQNMKYTF